MCVYFTTRRTEKNHKKTKNAAQCLGPYTKDPPLKKPPMVQL